MRCILVLLGLSCCFYFNGCGSSKPNETLTPEDASTIRPSVNADHDQIATQVEGNAGQPGDPNRESGPVVEVDRDETIAQAEALLAEGDLTGAESKLSLWLVIDPEDAEIIFRLAALKAQQNDLASGIELLSSIPVDHPEAGLPALGQSADWCFTLKRFDEAEQRYRQILAFIPGAAEAHRKLAFLFNRQGRSKAQV